MQQRSLMFLVAVFGMTVGGAASALTVDATSGEQAAVTTQLAEPLVDGGNPTTTTSTMAPSSTTAASTTAATSPGTTPAPTAPIQASRLPANELSASASSELAPVGDLTYWAGNVLDGNPATAWNHNSATSEPVGQWLRFDLMVPAVVDSVAIVNGYTKSQDVFESNHRVRGITIELIGVDGQTTRASFELSDSSVMQTLPLNADFEVTTIRFVVDSIYLGNRWHDLAISAVEIWTLS